MTLSAPNAIVEQVVLSVEDLDFSGGDEHLEIMLTHTEGGEAFSSTMAFSTTTDTSQDYDDWDFLSVQHLGESLTGEWAVSVYDSVSGSYLSGDDIDVELAFFIS